MLHKSETYGKIVLKAKQKETGDRMMNFAILLSKAFPWDVAIILDGLTELRDEGVIMINGDELRQPRMVRDNEKSVNKAKGGKASWENRKKDTIPAEDSQWTDVVVPEKKYETPTRSAGSSPNPSKVHWTNIGRYSWKDDFDDEFRSMYSEFEFNAYVAFNNFINEECESVRERTPNQITLKDFVKMFRKHGSNKAAAELIKSGMIKVAGSNLTKDMDLNSRLKSFIDSPLNKK
jgi:hypothetical protein